MSSTFIHLFLTRSQLDSILTHEYERTISNQIGRYAISTNERILHTTDSNIIINASNPIA